MFAILPLTFIDHTAGNRKKSVFVAIPKWILGEFEKTSQNFSANMSWWCRVWKWICFFYRRGACQKCGQICPAYRTFLQPMLFLRVHFVEQNGKNKHESFATMVVDIASCDVTCQLVLDSLSIAKDLLVVFRLLFNLCRPLLSIFSWRVACNLESFMLLSQQLSMLNPFHQNSSSLASVSIIHDIQHCIRLESISDFIKPNVWLGQEHWRMFHLGAVVIFESFTSGHLHTNWLMPWIPTFIFTTGILGGWPIPKHV